MNAANLSIYRSTELVLLWAVPVVESLPKSLPYQTLGGLLIRDLRECLDAITAAAQCKGQQRIECLDVLTARMISAKTTIRMMVELRRISHKQQARFIRLVSSVARQCAAWTRSTAEGVAQK